MLNCHSSSCNLLDIPSMFFECLYFSVVQSLSTFIVIQYLGLSVSCKNKLPIVWCHLLDFFSFFKPPETLTMSLRRKLNWCNLQGFVNSSVLCVITFVQATMTQWHCNCWVGDGMENEPIWGGFHFMYCVLISCTVLKHSLFTVFVYILWSNKN